MKEENYIDINKALWDERTKHHVGSGFYDMEKFMSGTSSLMEIELGLLGDVKDKTILHLQCHFGQDSLSLARMGANVTGVDFAEKAIETAKDINAQSGLDAVFILSDIYELPGKLDKQYDIVFATYGVIGWLPDIKKWASVVAHFLKPGGKLVFVEFHPVVWMFDTGFTHVQYSYFNTEAIIELEGTYAGTGDMQPMESISWNHSIGEVVQNLIDSGLTVTRFAEYDYSPYDCFKNTVKIAPDKYVIKGMEGKLPMVYSIVAVKQ